MAWTRDDMAARRGHQAPQHAEDEEVVAPVVAVDDEAFKRDADEGGIDGEIGRPPRCGEEGGAQAFTAGSSAMVILRQSGRP